MTSKDVLEFLKKNDLCVLATASLEGKPEAAVLVYTIQNNFQMYVFTETNTRKYPNIKENNQVALVIGGLKNDLTVQLDGKVCALYGKEARAAKEYTLNIHPEWKDYFESPAGVWFRIAPFWLRYSDFGKQPPEIFETAI